MHDSPAPCQEAHPWPQDAAADFDLMVAGYQVRCSGTRLPYIAAGVVHEGERCGNTVPLPTRMVWVGAPPVMFCWRHRDQGRQAERVLLGLS